MSTSSFFNWTEVIRAVHPAFFATVGVFSSLSLSVLGSAQGMLTIGSSMLGGAVHAPRIRSKNLVSAIFCEAIAIYGIIVSILLSQKIRNPVPDLDWSTLPLDGVYADCRVASWSVMWAGILVGICNYSAGITVGIVGSSTALADCLNPNLFFKMLIVEIFADALGLYATIIGILIAMPMPAMLMKN
eukprot:GHVH01000145.1.p1 GENE.GHVH01000145.1~~GHVH01000145.1.p1  ORF type:complete len:187 (+),score=11.57 GHVH01000145.1:92-652(+)